MGPKRKAPKAASSVAALDVSVSKQKKNKATTPIIPAAPVSAPVCVPSVALVGPIPVDEHCYSSRNGGRVIGAYDAMLSKTDLGKHQCKFYTLQVNCNDGEYNTFSRCE